MAEPRDLYELHQSLSTAAENTGTVPADGPEGPSAGPVLLHVFDGFIDAGQAGSLARDHLLATLDHRPLATFDIDALLDYRSRRPPMIFVEDHWEAYDEPHLQLHEMTDAAGVRFLLLEGAEPDIQWERFVAAVRELVRSMGVRLTIGIHGIPMGVPHTRPTSVTAHATRTELVAGRDAWVGTVQVPAAMTNLLEYRLGQHGNDAMGFAVHVPHYLAQSDYPAAAAALLENVAAATELTLPTGLLHAAAESTRTELDEQTLLAGRAGFPTADELGAELERFLAEQRGDRPPES